jgi:hypothetical protein
VISLFLIIQIYICRNTNIILTTYPNQGIPIFPVDPKSRDAAQKQDYCDGTYG